MAKEEGWASMMAFPSFWNIFESLCLFVCASNTFYLYSFFANVPISTSIFFFILVINESIFLLSQCLSGVYFLMFLLSFFLLVSFLFFFIIITYLSHSLAFFIVFSFAFSICFSLSLYCTNSLTLCGICIFFSVSISLLSSISISYS